MAKRVSKAALVRRIKELEEEIDDILSFHQLPVETISSWRILRKIRNTPSFISAEQYAQRYCLHTGEIGQLKGVRYCVMED